MNTMKVHTEALQPETFYHLYNRGINRENIFKTRRNYPFFLKNLNYYIQPVASLYAYCLLKNHFHLLIKTNSEADIFDKLNLKSNTEIPTKPTSFFISNQFAKLFNGYAQAINKAHNRSGGLFETPFRRVPLIDESHCAHTLCYIHTNPQHHGFCTEFSTYPYSSYHHYLLSLQNHPNQTEVISWFGSIQAYQEQHIALLHADFSTAFD